MQHTRTICLTSALIALGLAGCASPGLNEGRELIAAGQTEAGIARLRAGLAEEPDNIELKAYYHTQPLNSWQLLLIGDPLYRPFKKLS